MQIFNVLLCGAALGGVMAAIGQNTPVGSIVLTETVDCPDESSTAVGTAATSSTVELTTTSLLTITHDLTVTVTTVATMYSAAALSTETTDNSLAIGTSTAFIYSYGSIIQTTTVCHCTESSTYTDSIISITQTVIPVPFTTVIRPSVNTTITAAGTTETSNSPAMGTSLSAYPLSAASSTVSGVVSVNSTVTVVIGSTTLDAIYPTAVSSTLPTILTIAPYPTSNLTVSPFIGPTGTFSAFSTSTTDNSGILATTTAAFPIATGGAQEPAVGLLGLIGVFVVVAGLLV